MGRDLKSDAVTAGIAIVVLTLLFGVAYPLITTGAAQVLFPDRSDGSPVEVDGRVVGSRLIAQSFRGESGFFQPRPSATDYSADATAFSNLGPNSRELRDEISNRAEGYLAREGKYTPGLEISDVPVDAVTSSASGVDPHISEANARIQANRVAEARGLDLVVVLELVDEHTDGRALGVLGEPGVNVLELNIALDQEEAGA